MCDPIEHTEKIKAKIPSLLLLTRAYQEILSLINVATLGRRTYMIRNQICRRGMLKRSVRRGLGGCPITATATPIHGGKIVEERKIHVER